ncbi:MAG: DUF2148 domain-containing protein [Desulfurococcus sp.]|nr:DUF2148 domain-containing protein [Desulfurococcus sp.]
MIEREEIVRNAVRPTAELMAASAITAPKARGVDNIEVKILDERAELEALASRMEELAPLYGDFFKRDAGSVRSSHAVLLIGCRIVDFNLRKPEDYPLDPSIVCSLLNLGIAVGSAVKTASNLNIDNRVMYSIGVAARSLGLMSSDIVIGIPLSIHGKNIYFDRKAV